MCVEATLNRHMARVVRSDWMKLLLKISVLTTNPHDVAVFLFIISIAIYYLVKYILDRRGYEVRWYVRPLFFDSVSDYRNLKNAIRLEENRAELLKLIVLIRLKELSWVLFIAAFFLWLWSPVVSGFLKHLFFSYDFCSHDPDWLRKFLGRST